MNTGSHPGIGTASCTLKLASPYVSQLVSLLFQATNIGWTGPDDTFSNPWLRLHLDVVCRVCACICQMSTLAISHVLAYLPACRSCVHVCPPSWCCSWVTPRPTVLRPAPPVGGCMWGPQGWTAATAGALSARCGAMKPGTAQTFSAAGGIGFLRQDLPNLASFEHGMPWQRLHWIV